MKTLTSTLAGLMVFLLPLGLLVVPPQLLAVPPQAPTPPQGPYFLQEVPLAVAKAPCCPAGCQCGCAEGNPCVCSKNAPRLVSKHADTSRYRVMRCIADTADGQDYWYVSREEHPDPAIYAPFATRWDAAREANRLNGDEAILPREGDREGIWQWTSAEGGYWWKSLSQATSSNRSTYNTSGSASSGQSAVSSRSSTGASGSNGGSSGASGSSASGSGSSGSGGSGCTT